MTPDAQAKMDAITKPVDALLAQVVDAVGRLEEQKRDRDSDLLREVAGRIASDEKFRLAVILLAVD